MTSVAPRIPPNQDAPPIRFQIASRLGGLKDSVHVSDPFGTGAVFTVRRSGSNAHKTWFRERVAKDPLTHLMAESMLEAEPVVLTSDETEIVNGERAKSADERATPNPLLAVVDRIVLSTTEKTLHRDAMKRLVETGKISLMDMAGGRQEEDRLEEALFLLKSWSKMPDAEGGEIPFSAEMARELLTNDTPLAGAGVDDRVLQVEAWTVVLQKEGPEWPADVRPEDRIPHEGGDVYQWKVRHIIPGLTLGWAYQLYILKTARDTAIFRDKLVEAGGKNSVPSSGGISSSGDGESAPAS